MKLRLIIPVLLVVGFCASAEAAPKAMSVQVRQGQLRSNPSFLGKLVGTVQYGDRVQILASKGDWRQVSFQGTTGWVHTSALTRKKVVLAAGQSNTGVNASGEELALAGKGFNSDVEAQFKSRNQDIDFAWIDKMEAMKVAPNRMTSFLKKGGVTPSEGGGR